MGSYIVYNKSSGGFFILDEPEFSALDQGLLQSGCVAWTKLTSSDIAELVKNREFFESEPESEPEPSEFATHKDKGKLDYSLVPFRWITEMAKVLQFGQDKGYARSSYLLTENGVRRYYSSLMRHLEKFLSGEVMDTESMLAHLSHLSVNAMIMRDIHNGVKQEDNL